MINSLSSNGILKYCLHYNKNAFEQTKWTIRPTSLRERYYIPKTHESTMVSANMNENIVPGNHLLSGMAVLWMLLTLQCLTPNPNEVCTCPMPGMGWEPHPNKIVRLKTIRTCGFAEPTMKPHSCSLKKPTYGSKCSSLWTAYRCGWNRIQVRLEPCGWNRIVHSGTANIFQIAREILLCKKRSYSKSPN